MRQTGMIAAAALCAMLAVSGCQTSAVDALQTTAIGARSSTPGAADRETGKASFRAGNYGLAEKHFRNAVERDADDAEAWMGLAASCDELGRFDLADRAYEQLLRLAGRSPRVLNNMGYSQYLRGNAERARHLFVEARTGMADTTVVDANLALLDKG